MTECFVKLNPMSSDAENTQRNATKEIHYALSRTFIYMGERYAVNFGNKDVNIL